MKQVLAYTSQEYREDLGIIFFRWLSAVNTEQLMAGYTQVLESTDFDKVHCWLFDTRRRGPATAEGEDWYFHTYIPKLLSQLQQRHFIAVLHTPAHYIHLRDVVGFDTFHKYTDGTLLTMDFFDSEQKAVEWLQEMQEK